MWIMIFRILDTSWNTLLWVCVFLVVCGMNVAADWWSDVHDVSQQKSLIDRFPIDWSSCRKIIRGCLSKNQYRLGSFTAVLPADTRTDLQPRGHMFNPHWNTMAQRVELETPRLHFLWYKSFEMNPMFLCFSAAAPSPRCHHAVCTPPVCPRTVCWCWSQTAWQRASRRLIVGQMKATGCTSVRWEERLLQQIIRSWVCAWNTKRGSRPPWSSMILHDPPWITNSCISEDGNRRSSDSDNSKCLILLFFP